MPQCVQPGMQHAPRPVASEYCAGAARPHRLSPSGRRRSSLLRHAARQSHPLNGARPSGAIAGAGRRRMSPAHRSTRAQAAARRMRRWADRTTRRAGGSRRRVQTGALQRASGSGQRAPVVREGGSHDAARMLFSPPCTREPKNHACQRSRIQNSARSRTPTRTPRRAVPSRARCMRCAVAASRPRRACRMPRGMPRRQPCGPTVATHAVCRTRRILRAALLHVACRRQLALQATVLHAVLACAGPPLGLSSEAKGAPQPSRAKHVVLFRAKGDTARPAPSLPAVKTMATAGAAGGAVAPRSRA